MRCASWYSHFQIHQALLVSILYLIGMLVFGSELGNELCREITRELGQLW